MNRVVFIILFIICGSEVFSQPDTSYQYYNQYSRPTSKDSAVYLEKIYMQSGYFKRSKYDIKTNRLLSDEGFTTREFRKPHGANKHYYPNGILRDSIIYFLGVKKESFHFYETGARKAAIKFEASQMVEQSGWDEAGKKIRGYIHDREAQFPGGAQGWKTYLERNLNANVAAEDRAPAGIYEVKVQFTIDTLGNIRNIKAISVPSQCPSCGPEAVRIIQKGPKWKPAMQSNKRVIYQANQFVYFQVGPK